MPLSSSWAYTLRIGLQSQPPCPKTSSYATAYEATFYSFYQALELNNWLWTSEGVSALAV